MIFWSLVGLFIVSFIITALLAPKPEFENARADTLNPENFPRATENAPIPLILGRVRMNAPNTIWYGDFEAVPIREKVKTGLFSSTYVTVGYEYYVGLDLALGMGPNTVLREIYMDDKLLWSGTTSATAPTTFTISEPSFFGGKKKGGGFSSTVDYYPGALDLTGQPVNAYLESQVGVGNAPAYLGTAHAVFRKAYIGEASSLRKMAFVLENYPNSLGLPNAGKIGVDLNPAEAIYQIMTDKWRGMGLDPASINLPSLTAMGNTLASENNGCSVVITAETNGKTLIQEIMRQIDAIAYQDPDSGQILFKLIRNDYVVSSLPEYDELDVIKVVSFSRTGWEEIVSQVKITFPQRDAESDAVAISQDMATFAMIGRLKSTTIAMPFIYDKDLANAVASRERAQLSVPLFRITLEMNRSAYSLRPGDVFKFSWPEYGFSELVLRISEFDLGSLLDNKIVVKCIQDKFALANTVFAAPVDSAWQPPVTTPTSVSIRTIVEMPKFFSANIEYPIADGFVGFIPFVAKPALISSGFDMYVGKATGVLDINEPKEIPYLGTGILSAQYGITAGFATGFDNSVGIDISSAGGSRFNTGFTLGDIRSGNGGLLYMNGEWLGYTTAADLGSNNWRITNVYRGLLGTRPRTHAVGTRIYQFSPELLGFGTLDDLAVGATLYYKILDMVGARTQDLTEVTEFTQVMNANIAARPVRPGNLQLAGARTGITIADNVNRTLTWAPRNRLRNQIALENDVAETPDRTEVYVIQFFVNGVQNMTLSQTTAASATSATIPFSLTSIVEPNCEIRVYSRISPAGDLSADYAVLPLAMNQ